MFKRATPAASAWTVNFPLNEMEVGSLHSIPTSRNGKHNNNNNNNNNSKRRFDDTQIKYLETIFESEARPELRVKQQLANKLGLQPRQVAIWFQNKRARSKSKQIETEYNMLETSYDNLASKFETLKKENESLLIKVQKLRELTAKKGSEEYEKEDKKFVIHEKPDFPIETYSTQLYMTTCEDTNEELEYLGKESTDLDVPQITDASLTSPGYRCSLESTDLVDNSSCNSQWWEF